MRRRRAAATACVAAMTAISFLSAVPVQAAYDPSTSMALPFQAGATVYFNGPHNWDAPNHPFWPWNSLDLEPSPANTADPVYAPVSGKVHLNDCGFGVSDYIRIDPSGNNTGWQATFIHLSEVDVQNGSTVNRGDRIGLTGNPSNGCGSGTTIHTHLSIWYVASGQTWVLGAQYEEVDWGGVNRGGADVGNQPVIGDWVWTDGSSQYLGTATNIDTGTTATCTNSSGCIPTVSIYDDGDIPGQAPTAGPAIVVGSAYQVFGSTNWFSGGQSAGAISNDVNPTPGGQNGWGGLTSLGSLSVNFAGVPIAVTHGTSGLDVFAVASDGAMYDYSYSPGGGCAIGSPDPRGWCSPWSMTGGHALSGTAGVSVMLSSSGAMQVFGIGTDGNVWNYSYSPSGGCVNGGPTNGWCTSWKIPLPSGYSLSTNGGLSGLVFNGHMQLFGIDGNGNLTDYSYSPSGGCVSGGPTNGWCWGWSIPGGHQLSSYSAVSTDNYNNGKLQAFAIGTDGNLWDYSYSPSGGCVNGGPTNGWCTGWSLTSGHVLSTTSGVASANYSAIMQVFAIDSNGNMENYSYSPSGGCVNGGPTNGWCTSWAMIGGHAINTASGVAAAIFNNASQVYAVGSDSNLWSYSQLVGGSCPAGGPTHGWCTSWNMGGSLTNV